MFTPNSRPICIIRSSCTITSERYPAQSVQGAPVCACLTGGMLMCSTTPANSTDSVDENARAERPSRCPPGGVMPRLGTAPRGARPEPHPRQNRGFLSRLGARLRRAGQLSRAPRAPFRNAATVLTLLTTLTLSLGFVPSAGAQTTTCGTPDLGGRVEVWSATLTVEPITYSGVVTHYGYLEGIAGELSDTSFEFDSRTATVTKMHVDIFGDFRFGIDIDFDPVADQEFIGQPGLPTLEPLWVHFCDKALDLASPSNTITRGLKWGSTNNRTFDWSSTATIEVVLSKKVNSTATGNPSVTGMAEFRSTLTADTGTIADTNGLDDAVYSYQWVGWKWAPLPTSQLPRGRRTP